MAAFGRRLTWARLRQAGLRLVPEEFKVAHKPLTYGFKEYPVNGTAPVMPTARLRQMYESRRIDLATPLTTKDLLKHTHKHHAHQAHHGAEVSLPVPVHTAHPVESEVVTDNVPVISVEVPADHLDQPDQPDQSTVQHVAQSTKVVPNLSPAAQAAMRRPAPVAQSKQKIAR